jgi:ABC-type branched-subunit amino acid transport system ATPase component
MSSPHEPVFRTNGLTVRYGGVTANDAVDLEVHRGQVVGLIGPNGAGKTTYVDAVTGFAPATGEVWLAGRRIDRMPAHRRRRAGLARTWQAGELFDDLTVADNLAVAVQGAGLRGLAADVLRRRADRGPREPVLDDLDLAGDAARRPGSLSLGRQKLVGVARALAGESHVLMLDEPAAGLDTHESLAFGEEVRRMADRDLGILLIDHDMNLVLGTCDLIYVLDFGRVIASGTPGEVRHDPAVVAAYLGAEVAP